MDFFNSRLIFERMKEVTGEKSDKDLAVCLNVAATTLANWKNRNNLPIEVILSFAYKYKISLDWLFTGESKEAELDELSKGLLERFQALDFEGKLAILNAVTNKSAVNSGSVSQTQSGVGNVQVNQK